MWPDHLWKPGPLVLESDALQPTTLRGPATFFTSPEPKPLAKQIV